MTLIATEFFMFQTSSNISIHTMTEGISDVGATLVLSVGPVYKMS